MQTDLEKKEIEMLKLDGNQNNDAELALNHGSDNKQESQPLTSTSSVPSSSINIELSLLEGNKKLAEKSITPTNSNLSDGRPSQLEKLNHGNDKGKKSKLKSLFSIFSEQVSKEQKDSKKTKTPSEAELVSSTSVWVCL